MNNTIKKYSQLHLRYLIALLAIVASLTCTVASAASVWSQAYTDGTDMYDLHIVSNFDGIINTSITGIYLDNKTNGSIPVNELLTLSTEMLYLYSFSQGDTYDYYKDALGGVSIITDIVTQYSDTSAYIRNSRVDLQSPDRPAGADISFEPSYINFIRPITSTTGLPVYDLDFSSSNQFFTRTAVNSVPVPAATWLFVSGLLSLICVSRRRV